MGMNTTLFRLSFVLILTVSACTSTKEKQKAEQDKLYDEVMAIHDEVMPRMEEIYQYEKECETLIDSLSSADSLGNVAEIQTYQSLYEQLKEADAAMWQWMRAFQPQMLEQEPTFEKRMAYLEDEKEKITYVNKVMVSALEAAEKKFK